MTRINIKRPELPQAYLEDCSRIQEVFAKFSFEITVHEAEELWHLVSEDLAAGWLSLDSYDDYELFEITKPFWTPEEDSDQEQTQEF